uniref:Cytochrome P450 n=1 Tax=Heterorhabditis bacteriophora TaxID=37862 RepID=A0A1I7XCM3_HETBA
MASSTHINDTEVERRESYIRAGLRQREILDPFTWSYPWKHYMELHPDDFDHFKDRSGRPFAQIILPWYPRRTQYTKYD